MLAEGKLKFPLEEIKQVVKKWLYLENDEIIDVMVATHLANQFDADPIWMLFIAPPSSTKTELLRGFKGHPDIYSLSTLTPATLISGKKTKDGVNPSLLFKLNNKTLILKDFTTILSMRSESQQEILAQLREVYDGYFKKAFGTGDVPAWEGRVGLMAACTPVYDRHYGVIGSMGDRFMLYRSPENNNRKMGFRAQKLVGREDEMRQEIRTAIHKFIDQFKDLKNKHFAANTDEVNEMIVALACFIAIARTHVDRDWKTQRILYQPEPEGSGRLTKQFTQLGYALALVQGRNNIDESVYRTIAKIGRDLIVKQRLKILQHMWNERIADFAGHWKTTKEIATPIDMPTTTVKFNLEDLMIIGAVKQDLESDGETSPYIWQLSQEICELIGSSEVFEKSQNNS
jgi:hypothetical protein